ncbi:hypothetical protein [Streptosporangium nondiastaticum]|uniref:hypothetical protein n=1 Tax=Streptosporangium nondiastaticum TaxID=35764 RepID=UPI001671CB62|nr:hypothetical protein [Streptosporangium nondiastaticum]
MWKTDTLVRSPQASRRSGACAPAAAAGKAVPPTASAAIRPAAQSVVRMRLGMRLGMRLITVIIATTVFSLVNSRRTYAI